MTRALAPVDTDISEFCGVVAIASATGRDVGDVRELVDGSMGYMHMRMALQKLGVEYENDSVVHRTPMKDLLAMSDRNITLPEFITKYANDGAAYIVGLRGHVVAIANGEIVDNGYLFSTTPTSVTEKAMKSRRRLATNSWIRIA